MPVSLMPARHQGPSGERLNEPHSSWQLWSTREGVGETSGQRLDRIFEPRRCGPAEETEFLRSVRIKPIRSFIQGRLARGGIWSW